MGQAGASFGIPVSAAALVRPVRGLPKVPLLTVPHVTTLMARGRVLQQVAIGRRFSALPTVRWPRLVHARTRCCDLFPGGMQTLQGCCSRHLCLCIGRGPLRAYYLRFQMADQNTINKPPSSPPAFLLTSFRSFVRDR